MPDCNFLFVVIILSLASYNPVFLPLSTNLWLWEKALKEGLARVNGGQLCQLLHPNEAALSFTKPQLITLQAISEQDCLSESPISPSPFPHNQQHNDEACGMKGVHTVLSLPWKEEDVLLPYKVNKKMVWFFTQCSEWWVCVFHLRSVAAGVVVGVNAQSNVVHCSEIAVCITFMSRLIF